ncbi:phosphoribosylglycinamide synthetase [Candidatus Poribacteria bacterium]|nr:MAG: phosphoribosylglycinamide synthetase [Candidatus Poribacteria bacterium]
MDPNKKRILLLLPTRTYRAKAFLSAASQLGVTVAIGSDQPQTLSELSPRKSLVINFGKPENAVEEIVEFAQTHPIDAVVGVDDETTVLVSMVSEALSLPHNSVESARTTRSKYQMRKVLATGGIPSPHFELASISADPAKIAAGVAFPCVLKPLSLSASRGVIRANNPTEFVKAFHTIVSILGSSDVKSRKDARAQQILIEDFIPGIEVALEGILIQGRLKVLAIFDKPDPLDGPFFEETLYVTPSRLPVDVQNEIVSCTARTADVLGLREGPVHAELRVNDDGAWIIEIAARSIGGLCARTLRFGAGISLEELIIRHAIGLEVESLQRERQPAGVMMIPIPHAGILREVRGKADAEQVLGIEEVTISIPIGQEVLPLPEGAKYLGFIFARGSTPASVEASLREAHRRLEFVIADEKL